MRAGIPALLLASLLIPAALRAETISAQRIAATVRLLPLRKITVGPDDQYHGTVDAAGTTLIFTRKSDLVPHLCRQDIATGEVKDWLPLTADSQDPALSLGGLVAFAYYKNNARGDICHRRLEGKPEDPITCLKSGEGEQSSPFWRSARELGFLERDPATLHSRIFVENIDTGARTILAEGRIWSPAMKPGGRYLAYNELEGTELEAVRVLVLQDLQTGMKKTLRFQLPGISGFPAFSDDERMLFFSHYLNDTNHDNVIDGGDDSVIFRAPVAELLKGDSEIFPEQLTPVENNCSFPRPHGDQLFVTCAFEGGLDVYQLPVTGVVPVGWGERNLWNALQTSRSYQERILILNTLKFRASAPEVRELQKLPKLPKLNDQLEERLLSDHLLADDTTAAKFHLKRLQHVAAPGKKDLYGLLHLFLEALEKKKSQPSEEEVSSRFVADIREFGAKIGKAPGPARFKGILRGMLATFINQPRESLALLKSIRFDSPADPLERHYFFDLASWTLPRVKGPGPGLAEVYHQMMTAPELTEESRIYYGFRFLQYLQTKDSTRPGRIAAIGKAGLGLSPQVASLLQSEALTLRLLEAPDEDRKSAVYRELDQLMSASRSDYFLRKAQYIRSILNFTEAAEFKYLNFIATNWLRYTAGDDTEFSHAREVYANATLDQAYDALGKNSLKLADNYFYGALSLTDDLEAHSGYIRTMVQEGERATVDVRYANLQQRQFIDDNMKFVQALLGLLDARPKSREDTGHLDKAITKLKSMTQDRDSPVRYLLLGSCYLDKLERLAQGYDFDAETFEGAHRNLMLAYDLGRDNARIKAAALMDLGLLHQRVQDHGLAAKFFSRRKELGFTSGEESTRFGWHYARSLFYSNQPEQAARELEQASAGAGAAEAAPLLERRAFYLQAAGKYEAAVSLYRGLLKGGALKGDLNLAKAHLGYGFSLFMLKKEREARESLKLSLEHSGRLGPLPKDPDRLGSFEPVRLRLNATGLLSRLGSSTERLDALEQRARLLNEAGAETGTELYDDGLALVIQNRLMQGQIHSATDPAQSVVKMRDALKFAEKLGDSGQYLSHAVFEALAGYLEQGFLHPRLYQGTDASEARRLLEKTIQAYERQKTAQSMLDFQKLKLRLLWSAFERKVLGTGSKDEIDRLLAASPEPAVKLQGLAAALSR